MGEMGRDGLNMTVTYLEFLAAALVIFDAFAGLAEVLE